MNITTGQIEADVNRQFDDWGQSVTHQLIAATFNSETLENVESIDELELTALMTATHGETAAGSGGHYIDSQLSFTFRSADLPAAADGQYRRIIFQDVSYDVTGLDVHSIGQVTTLHCRKRANA